MSVERVELVSWSGGEDESGGSYQIVFNVKVTSVDDGPQVVRSHMLQQYGFTHGVSYSFRSETDAASKASSIEVSEITQTVWSYTIDFTSSDETEEDENPLNRPISYSRSAEQRERPFERDIHGRAVANSAGDRFDELIMLPTSRTVVTAQRNLLVWPQSLYRYVNTTNRRPVVLGNETYGRRRVRISNMSDVTQFADVLKDEVTNPTGAYQSVTVEFTFADDDWDLVMKDQGLYQSFRRWRIIYGTQRDDGSYPTITIPAPTAREAREIFEDRGGDNDSVRRVLRLSDGRQSCRVEPPELPDENARGEASSIVMPLNGEGRQLANSRPSVYLQFLGFRESEFGRLNLGA